MVTKLEGPMAPIVLDEMAYSFAAYVARSGFVLDVRADTHFATLLPSGADRRAAIAIALSRKWIATEERPNGRLMYVVCGAFWREKNARFERTHGIGSAPREE